MSKVIDDVIELANKQVEIARDIEAVEQTLKQMQKRYNNIALDLLPDLMRANKLEEVRLEDGSIIRTKQGVSVNIKKADTVVAYKWLDDNGYGDIIKTQVVVSFDRTNEDREKAAKLIGYLTDRNIATQRKESIHGSTLKAFAMTEVEKGTNFPPEITVHDYTYADVKLGKKES